MSACLLSLSVMSLLLPVWCHIALKASEPWLDLICCWQTAFHASFTDNETADKAVLRVSRGTSVVSHSLAEVLVDAKSR